MQRPLLFIQTPTDEQLKNMHEPVMPTETKEASLNSLIKRQLSFFMRLHPGFRYLRFVLKDGSVYEGTLVRLEEPHIWIEVLNKTLAINGNDISSIKRIK